MNKDDEIVCYILIRNDLGMSPGKMVAQGGHAVHLMLDELFSMIFIDYDANDKEWYNKWMKDGITKITLAVNEAQLIEIVEFARMAGYTASKIRDEGRTEVPENSLTAACLQPMPRGIAKQFVGKLRLL